MTPQASEVDKERLEVALKRVTKDSQRRAPGVFEKMFKGCFGGMNVGGKNGGMISICSKFMQILADFLKLGEKRKVNMDVSENSGFSSPIIHLFIGFSIIFTIHFGVFPYFLETPIWRNDINMSYSTDFMI